MRRVPTGSSRTRPAFFSSRRCRETAGRLIGSSSAICCTDRPSSLNICRIARRLASPSASKGSPAGAGVAIADPRARSDRSHAVVAGVVLDLGPTEVLQHRRDIVPEAAPQALLEAVPAADGIVGAAGPGLDGAVGCGLLLVGIAQRLPLIPIDQHGPEGLEAPEVVAGLAPADLHHQDGGVERLPPVGLIARPAA